MTAYRTRVVRAGLLGGLAIGTAGQTGAAYLARHWSSRDRWPPRL
jgi:hypothetical protein